MAQIRRFEDLVAWQQARALTKCVYELTRDGTFAKDYRLASQMQAASVSIMSNIAEGFERATKKEYLHFLSIAKASCAEVRSQVYVALDVAYLSGEPARSLLSQCERVSKLIGGLANAVKGSLGGAE